MDIQFTQRTFRIEMTGFKKVQPFQLKNVFCTRHLLAIGDEMNCALKAASHTYVQYSVKRCGFEFTKKHVDFEMTIKMYFMLFITL